MIHKTIGPSIIMPNRKGPKKRAWLKVMIISLLCPIVAGLVIAFITNHANPVWVKVSWADTVPKVYQYAKIDSGNNNNIQQQVGNGNVQVGPNNKGNINSPSKKVTITSSKMVD